MKTNQLNKLQIKKTKNCCYWMYLYRELLWLYETKIFKKVKKKKKSNKMKKQMKQKAKTYNIE